jgi:hypothetical protein
VRLAHADGRAADQVLPEMLLRSERDIPVPSDQQSPALICSAAAFTAPQPAPGAISIRTVTV